MTQITFIILFFYCFDELGRIYVAQIHIIYIQTTAQMNPIFMIEQFQRTTFARAKQTLNTAMSDIPARIARICVCVCFIDLITLEIPQLRQEINIVHICVKREIVWV